MKIGVFDSGLGGLTVVQAMTEVIKGAELFYVADTKNAPYGEKTTEEILQYSLNITQYLLNNHQIDALIVACNTATSAAIKYLLLPHLYVSNSIFFALHVQSLQKPEDNEYIPEQ